MAKLQYNSKASAESTEILLSETKQVIRKQSEGGSLAAQIRYRLLGRMRRNICTKTGFSLKSGISTIESAYADTLLR